MKNLKACLPLFALTLMALPIGAWTQGPPQGDPLNPDLFQAISGNDLPRLTALLEKGAKVEQPNWLGMTPLAWAALMGNQSVCDALIKHGASLKTETPYGSALETAQMSNNPALVPHLIARGAQPTKNRADRITALMVAAEQGSTENMAQLIALKMPIDAADSAGNTALTYASRRGRLNAVWFLLERGAQPTKTDTEGRTALHHAAQNGHADVVRLLLTRGAKPNAKDKKGDTPLLLAQRYSGDLEVLKTLRKFGAKTEGRDRFGLSYTELAKKRSAPMTGELAPLARRAVERSLPLIERSTETFSKVVGCSSCHHQGVGLAATGVAQRFGFTIAQKLATEQKATVTRDYQAALPQLRGLLPRPEIYKVVPTVDIKEYAPQVGTTLFGLTAHNGEKSETTEAMSTLLARQQEADGSWRFYFHRAPSQSSPFMTTALAVQALATYLPPSLATERDERITRAQKWLTEHPATTNEDRGYRLLGLRWAGAEGAVVEAAAAELKRVQRPDGGWAQFTTPTKEGHAYSKSDAYATGQALYALHQGGEMPVSDPVYQRGVKYLLRTQDEDGSWFVNKRAVPANNYLDTGFPHGQAQFISYDATSWATMALVFASINSPVAPHKS